jgi:ribosomal protein S18 acetylase RimI-like enzyme
MPSDDFQIIPVRTPTDLTATIGLFRSYAASLGIDLAYQGFEAELAALPGDYAPPAGELLMARDAAGKPMGCVGLRPLNQADKRNCCEMKRLYVSPFARGSGLGQTLAMAIIAAAMRSGYREIWLDTLPFMEKAQALYRKLGFEPMEAYYQTPIAGTVFMRRKLDASSSMTV